MPVIIDYLQEILMGEMKVKSVGGESGLKYGGGLGPNCHGTRTHVIYENDDILTLKQADFRSALINTRTPKPGI